MSVRVEMQINPGVIRKVQYGFDALPGRVFSRVVRRASSRAMTPVLKRAKQRVPVRHKLLKKSLGRKVKAYSRDGVVAVIIGPRKGFKDQKTGANPANYAHLVEGGTAPHVIQTKSGAVIKHPGARPQPFLRNSLEERKTTVVGQYQRELASGINIEVDKLKVNA